MEILDDDWLDGAGLLRTGRNDRRTKMLPDCVQQLLLRLIAAGGQLPLKLVGQEDADALLLAEAHGVVQWESDSRGHPCQLQLSWRGQERARMLLTQALAEQKAGQSRIAGLRP